MAVGNYTGMVLLDLQKAFDTADYDILCNKLQAMGVQSDSVKWFKSYLSDRQQIVSVSQVESKPMNISCGVPQGIVFYGHCFSYVMLTICHQALTVICCYMLTIVPCSHLEKILK